MKSRFEVCLNGIALSDIHPASIYITDIAYAPAAPQIKADRLMGRHGGFSGRPYIEKTEISVSLMIREYDTAARQAVAQSVIAWAYSGGWLTASDRPGQRIYVRCTKLPAVTSALKWTEALTIGFTAYDFPFWQSIAPVTVSLDSGDEGTLRFPGGIPTEAEAVITAEETMTAATVTVGDTAISLAGINIAAGDTVEIRYTDDRHIMEIVSGTTSLLDKRTGADDLIVNPGANAVSFTSTGDASCIIKAREVYL